MRAMSSNVIIEKDPPETETTTGILLTGELDPTRNVSRGTVRSVGPGRTDEKGKFVRTDSELQEGRRVLYKDKTVFKNDKRHNPNEQMVDGRTFVHVDSSEVISFID